MKYPKMFKDLIEFYKIFPGIGEKGAERFAFKILEFSDEKLEKFANIMSNIKTEIEFCPVCGCLSEKNNCENCKKDNCEIICVVEDSKDAYIFDKINVEKLSYHVLGGLISPINGINPDDINIKQLLNRVETKKPKEVILALKSGVEGSTTSLYIKKILETKNIKVTQIAQGVPIGTNMEYLDTLTLELALKNRDIVE